MLILKNPHSVLAAIENRPEDVEQVTLPTQFPSEEGWAKVGQAARAAKVKVTIGGGGARDAGRTGGRSSAAEARVRDREGISSEELFSDAADRSGGKGLWLALDSLTDPQNVGAIFRAAAFFGVEGILITQERSAPLTATVYDIACGGMEAVPFALQVNLQRALETAKKNGLWILGTSEHAKNDLLKVERDRPWLLVLGNEERGIRRLTEETCDLLCAIPPRSKTVTSLNVSVAAGIAISHLAPRG
jgi:23S rRNA (guanosine2251-2'-O)-methyltransferase